MLACGRTMYTMKKLWTITVACGLIVPMTTMIRSRQVRSGSSGEATSRQVAIFTKKTKNNCVLVRIPCSMVRMASYTLKKTQKSATCAMTWMPCFTVRMVMSCVKIAMKVPWVLWCGCHVLWRECNFCPYEENVTTTFRPSHEATDLTFSNIWVPAWVFRWFR